MSIQRKYIKGFFPLLIKLLAVLLLLLIVLVLCLVGPTWPSKARLCRNLVSYIPKNDCLKLKNRFEILDRAFPIGKATSDDIKSTLGKYFHEAYQTTYGHREVYYLSSRPIGYLLNYQEKYHFKFDRSGILIGFIYEDW